MLNRMIAANLARRPTRSVVTVLAVAMEMMLILLIIGLTNGVVNDSHRRAAGIGADIEIQKGQGSVILSMSGNSLPQGYEQVLLRQPGVAAATGVTVQSNGNSLEAVDGIDPTTFDAVSGGFTFLAGHMFQPGTYQAIVDNVYAAQHHVRVGETIPLLGHSFALTGIFEEGKGFRIKVPRDILESLAGAPGRCAVFYVKLRNPNEADAEAAQLQKALGDNLTIRPMQEYLDLLTAGNIPYLAGFQEAMIGVAIAIGFLVVLLSMYTAILERTREVGILKSLGASRAFIVQAVLREGELLTLIGVAAGVAGTYLVRHLIHGAFPGMTIEVTAGWVGRATLIAVLGGGAGAVYPAWKAARQDTIAALAYE